MLGAYIGDIKTESLSTDGLELVTDRGLLHEADIDRLDMWEVRHELQLHAHQPADSNVFDQNRHASCCQAFSETDFEHNLRIDLVFELTSCEIKSVFGREGEGPVHHDNVIVGVRERPHFVNARRLGAECELCEAKRIQEARCVDTEDLIDGGGDRL